MAKILFLIISAISLVSGIHATELNVDGSFKIKPYSQKQLSDLELLSRDINDIHKKILELLPYMNKEKKINNNQYLKETSALKDIQRPYNIQFMINENFAVGLNLEKGSDPKAATSIKLESMRFTRRRSRLGKYSGEDTTIQEIINTSAGKVGYDGIELRIKRTRESGVEEKKYTLLNMVDPKERVKLVRSYRDSIDAAMRYMDKIIESAEDQELIEAAKTIRELR
ncbi:MAG: hypothetical protein K8R21_13420 [Leptospira sp.]|nr:hypothetical protein [Leptospira sp.]